MIIPYEVLVAAARGNTALQDRLLAFHAGQSCAREEIGEVAEGYTVVNAGTGLASSPLGLVFTSPMLQNNTTVNTVSVDLDGTGLASSPLGFTQFRTVDFSIDGTGLASSPLGLTQLRFLAFEGTGLASSPLGFHMMNVLSHVNGTGLASSPLGFDSNPVLLNSGLGLGVSLTGSSLGDQVSEDGWSTPGGLDGASILAQTDVVGIEPTDGVFGSGESGGAGAEEIDPMDIQPED